MGVLVAYLPEQMTSRTGLFGVIGTRDIPGRRLTGSTPQSQFTRPALRASRP
jgi:hypothetical protein